jgi:hypothetical protein
MSCSKRLINTTTAEDRFTEGERESETNDLGQHALQDSVLCEQDETQTDSLEHLHDYLHRGILTERDGYLFEHGYRVSAHRLDKEDERRQTSSIQDLREIQELSSASSCFPLSPITSEPSMISKSDSSKRDEALLEAGCEDSSKVGGEEVGGKIGIRRPFRRP